MKQENTKPSFRRIVYTLILFILVGILIGVLIKSKFILTDEIIFYIILIVFYVLAPEFDKLSINNILTVSKNIKEIKEETDNIKKTEMEIKKEQEDLKMAFNLISTQISNINNQNTNNQVVQFPEKIIIQTSSLHDLIKTKFKENELSNEVIKIEENLENNEQKKSLFNGKKTTAAVKVDDYNPAYLELYMLNSIMEEYSKFTMHYNVKLKGNKSFGTISYDAMVRTGSTSRVFIESKVTNNLLQLTNSIKELLKGLDVYSKDNKAELKLLILIPQFNNKNLYKKIEKEQIINSNSDLKEAFLSGKLEIREIPITKEEVLKYQNELDY